MSTTDNSMPHYLTHMKEKSILAAIAVTLLIIALSVTIILYFKPLYYMDMNKYQLAEKYDLTEEQIKENYGELIWYNTLICSEDLNFPHLPMSESGRIHFKEVKSIFLGLQWIGIACLILLTPILSWAKTRKEYRWLKYTAYACFGIPAVLGILMLFAWEDVFVIFHKIFFRNDYWLFDPATDPIINYLPDGFFLHCAVGIVVLVIAGGGFCLYQYRRILLAADQEKRKAARKSTGTAKKPSAR